MREGVYMHVVSLKQRCSLFGRGVFLNTGTRGFFLGHPDAESHHHDGVDHSE